MDLDRKAMSFVRASSAVINELATTKRQGPSWRSDDWVIETRQTAYQVLVAARAAVAAAEVIIEMLKPPPPREIHEHHHDAVSLTPPKRPPDPRRITS